MIRADFLTDPGGSLQGFHIQGHAGCGEAGFDIVCAAVSTLVQTAYLALKDIGVKTEYIRDDGRFEFSVECSKDTRHDADVILRAMTVGLRDLQSGYPQSIKLKV